MSAPANTTELPERPKEAEVPKADPQAGSAAPSEKPKDAKPPKKAKAPKQPKEKAPPKNGGAKPKAAKPETVDLPQDPDYMFKVGFLADVYEERPISEKHPKIITRFPPEPNGFLHFGHSKAIAINFGFARYRGGECILRYDDTNPAGEDEVYYKAIEEMVSWLGFKPVRSTSASENFQQLYEYAVDLIKKDGAYVCHCSKAEIKVQRGEGTGKERFACSHRDRPIEESLKEFQAMKEGKYKAGEAALRMKQDITNPNPQMWDLFAWRILDTEEKQHHKTGAEWKMYPTYDFAHPLCDSIENITHSLCTTEFEQSRVSYDWLVNKLGVYQPMQREYGRLNITGTILSKRKIIELVNRGHVRGWDDPRLYTLIALRRRGVPPGAILSFVNGLGVTKNNSNVQVAKFDQAIRQYLEATVPRLMLVLEPLKVVIDNLPDDYLEEVEVPFSKDPAFGTHKVPFTKTVYIERSDFREVDSSDFFRLAPGKSVGLLKVPFPITATSFDKDPETGLVSCVYAKYEKPEEGATFKKPKSYIHWVGESAAYNSPIKAEVRAFNPLFKSEDPSAHPDGYLADLNADSENIYKNAFMETGFRDIQKSAPWPKDVEESNTDGSPKPWTVRFQGMRVAYFTVDKDSTDDQIVLNRIVTLKDDKGKS
ncbi:hypothetical protein ASPZODRAFT_891934 [Penicilliopsis zonata CBS 506.65]|uniref:glutamine--tRNA ligase n=1 Tax=Penicilliopsis zonata CBS 506.65 TaxID=1073090 RepID=A0A1L9S9U8_9EURO|nr:hypothetical protein ASPZODRAFT_891934 [Penicilliopsis zonata CBS 506.65]OJJ43896.1 hypothetical protein ASPZODRAFT_891934 [Penicilliopsis zonata CBS 506.65]